LALLVLQAVAAPGATFTVNMVSGNRFSPPNLTINVGDTVKWVNTDFVAHDTVSGTNGVPAGVWKSALLARGSSFSFTFNVPTGYYGYYCTPHWALGMVGSITVVPANVPPSVTITNPVDGALFIAGANVPIQATASDSDGTVSKVDFFSNGALIGSATIPPYGVTFNSIPGGNYALLAVATDNLGASATSAVVNITADLPPHILITNPVNGDKFPLGTNVLIQTDASDPDGAIRSVEFFNNGASVGLITNSPFSLTLSNLPVGNYSLSALATDNLGATSNSPPVNISVFIPPKAPTILRSPQSQTGQVGSPITFLVSASGTAPLRYQWQFHGADIPGATTDTLLLPQITTNNAGSYVAVVTNDFGSAASSPALLTVTLLPNVPPTVTISSPAEGAKFPSNSTVAIVANAIDTDGVITQVEFLTRTNFNQTNSLGILTQPPFTLFLSNLTAGTYSLQARATDDRGGVALSPELSFTVHNPPNVSLTRSPNDPAVALGTNIILTATADSPGLQVTNLALFEGTTILGQSSSSPFNFTWRPAQPGTYSVTVRATDELGQSSVSTPLTVRIFKSEFTRPTLKITNSPANFVRLTSPGIAMAGVADDNVGLDHVEYQINDGPIQFASGTKTWAFRTNLLAGPNTVRVRSVDLAGNPSLDDTRFFTYVVNAPISVHVQGNGSVSPDLNGSKLEVGKVYTLTAHPAAAQLFAGWGGVTNTNSAILNFVMQPELALVANFVPNPFYPAAGNYAGLFFDTNKVAPECSGLVTFQVGNQGSFTGTLAMRNARYPFQGKFDPLGNTTVPVVRRAMSPIAMVLKIDLGGADKIEGHVSTASGTNLYTAQLLAERNVFNTRSNPFTEAGQRPLVFKQLSIEPLQNLGSALATITSSGTVRVRGSLIEQRKFSLTSALSRDETSPFYLSLKGGTEIVIGWLDFNKSADATVSGTLLWTQPSPGAPLMIEVTPQ
jgi:plastocyanin